MPANDQKTVTTLTEDQIEEIAERAAEKAVLKLQNEIYRHVGRSVIDKLYYVVGVMIVAALAYAASKGWLKP